MPGVKVNDIKIFYEMHGEGAPLLLIMGWTASSESWDPQLIEELSRSYTVIVFDNRGTGRSDKPDAEYSIGMMTCLLYTSPSPRDRQKSRMPSSA